MSKFNYPKSNSSKRPFWLKNLLLTWALGLTLASCSYDGSDRDPRFVDNDDKKELVLSNGKHIWIIKDRSDTGSPYHIKDKDGNRLLSGLDIESYQDLWDNKFLFTTDDQKGIYDFTTNKYILSLDNYLNIDKISLWSSIMIVNKWAGNDAQYNIIDISTGATVMGESKPELVGTWWEFLMRSGQTYRIYDAGLTEIYNSQSSVEPKIDGSIIIFSVLNRSTWNNDEVWYDISAHTTISTPTTPVISNTIVLWDSLTATPTIATWWEFYDIKDVNDSTIVKNCYQPINRGTYAYAVTDWWLDSKWNKIYKLHIINTITNKKKVRIIDKYEANSYLP